ncbi:MAG: hypothetical protein HY719_03545 [Planctomycetes bacterium]|nr:hypothetical protein [Planctomycetota bacterium]
MAGRVTREAANAGVHAGSRVIEPRPNRPEVRRSSLGVTLPGLKSGASPPTGTRGPTATSVGAKVYTSERVEIDLNPATNVIETFVSKDALGSNVLYNSASSGMPVMYTDYTPYGRPLAVTAVGSASVRTSGFVPGGSLNALTNAVYPYPTMNLSLGNALPSYLTAAVLFNMALYCYGGAPDVFEIVDARDTDAVPDGQIDTVVAVAADGEIAAGHTFLFIRGDVDKFGITDIAAFAPTTELRSIGGGEPVPVTKITLTDAVDRTIDPIEGTIDASIVGAHVRPNPTSLDTYEVVGYEIVDIGTEPSEQDKVCLSIRGDVSALITMQTAGSESTTYDHAVLIYPKSPPLSNTAFAGYYWDGESNLNYTQWRYLDTRTGRWTTRDPAGYLTDLSAWMYAVNQPAAAVDASGLNGRSLMEPDGSGGGSPFSLAPPTEPRWANETVASLSALREAIERDIVKWWWHDTPALDQETRERVQAYKRKAEFLLARIDIVVEALNYNAANPDWYATLPDCPCTNPDAAGVVVVDGWARSNWLIGPTWPLWNGYHPGAENCFRSYPTPANGLSVNGPGQQCCYDCSGNLITSGSGAGTPDRSNTVYDEFSTAGPWEGSAKYTDVGRHSRLDVDPWKVLASHSIGNWARQYANEMEPAWSVYNLFWPPNQGVNPLTGSPCPKNHVVR